MSNEAHIRIDEGVKRGPRKPKQPKTPLNAITAHGGESLPNPVNQHTETLPRPNNKLAEASVEAILDQYLQGLTTSQIAAQHNCTRQALGLFLRSKDHAKWVDAQVILAIEKKEKAEDDLASSQDALSLARAREQLRGAQWELERVFNRVYGQKQEVTHTGVVTISHALEAISERRRGHDAAQLPQSSIDGESKRIA